MPEINVILVKALRERTAAGVMNCKNVLVEAGGDIDAAAKLLQERRLLPEAAKRRPTSEGLLVFMIEERCGAIIELAAETDFVSRNPLFQRAAEDLARVVVAVRGRLDETLAAPSPDGQGDVAGYISRLAATFGENIHLRRTAILETEHGIIGAYAHNAPAPGLGRMVALVSVSGADSDVAANEIARKLAVHVVGAAPLWTTAEQVPAAIRNQKRLGAGRNHEHHMAENELDSAIEVRLQRFYDQTVLLRQQYLLEPSRTVAEALLCAAGPAAYIEDFVCYRVGEDAAHDARVAQAAEFEWTFGNDWSNERPARMTVLGEDRIFEVSPTGPRLRDDRDAVDLINAAWSRGATVIALPVARLAVDFFPLSTRKAGTILQKFSNFGTRVAIVGDLSVELAQSSALRDFIFETNNRGQVIFVQDLEALTQKLRQSQHPHRADFHG
ncbi:translation elongation factor Ts [Phyllobacterium salinisoli]|uniref:Elongation factor Ts n=1 Tax=Phyllobacterium salinisoli TaxID=1899321 RepID=A0A368K8L7_9HYPH|nr:translation elongation factor Ts [Phyllobacterium salinisoli]RCS25697.1 translation elongation factor Ts [Phyllobacterium salinisoli]